MVWTTKAVVAASVLGAASAVAWAQPQIVSLGSGVPNSVTPNAAGTCVAGGSGISGTGAGRWTLSGAALTSGNIGGTGVGLISADGAFATVTELNSAPQINGNTATNVSPPFSMTPTLTPVPLAATEGRAARWTASSSLFQTMGGLPIVPSLMVYGSGSSGSGTGNFQSPNAISQNGRFIVGMGYISTYTSSAGTAIGNNTFQWRPWIWDAEANAGAGAYTVLPTPFRTSSNTWRRRTGNAYAVSNDGLVIVGAQEHNVAGSPSADPDAGRPVVWRWDAGSSEYVMSFLPNGVNGSGFPFSYSSTPGTFFINAAGTMIVGRAVDNAGTSLYVARWDWDAGTSTWSTPVNIGSGLAAPASWLPGAVTGCSIPPTLTPTGMSDDGSIIVGQVVYSTCGSFMSGGFIWTSEMGSIADWYDYMSEAAGPEIAAYYGPIGDNGDPNRGLARLGYPTSISTDGSAIVGFQGGTQRIPGAPSWIALMNGGPGCVAPAITSSSSGTVNFSACSSSIILNVLASGTLPISYQWQKDGVDLVNGPTASGSVIDGATSLQLRVNPLLTPSDAGSYVAVVTAGCGSSVASAASTVQVNPSFPAAANDTCAGAQVVTTGTNVLSPAQSPCSAYINDPIGGASCIQGMTKVDRWFSFTPSSTDNYRLETCGSNYDTVLSVFADCAGSELACNNDYTTGPTTGCTGTRSRINSVQMVADTAYLIRIAAPIGAFLSDTSTMNLSIFTAPAAAPNDTCAGATAAVIGANALDTTEATNDGVASCNTALGRDVWFTFTPPARGSLRLATCPGTTWNTVLTVFDGCFGTELGCNDNANVTGCTQQSVIDYFPVVSTQTYVIRVGTNSASLQGGTGTLTVSFRCGADFNADNVVNSQDFFDFLNVFFVAGPTADFNGDTVVNSQDFFDFLNAFFAGC